MKHLVIQSEHAHISITENKFLCVEVENDDKIFRLITIGSIAINSSCTIGPGTLHQLAEKNISLIGIEDDEVLGIWRSHKPDYLIQFMDQQIQYMKSVDGRNTYASWLLDKYVNQLNLLKKYNTQSQSHSEKVEQCIKWYEEEVLDKIIHIEGSITKLYYAGINKVLPANYRFLKRTRPAEDVFNACINYAYYFLYQVVEDALEEAKLNCYYGIFHSNKKAGKSLVYDFIEPFRPWIDKCVIEFLREEMEDVELKRTNNKVKLPITIKRKLVIQVQSTLNERVKYNNQSKSRKGHIYHEAKRLRRKIIEFSKDNT